ncbi:MAG: ketopantoate reductase family protein [Phycisphaerae bacterium]|nr:ketopantoate reductase family protein [Phycisphaerae bacterium]
MNVLIYGAGAVGQAVGGLLAEAGCRVAMLLRPRVADAIRAGGLHVTGLFGDHHIPAERLTLAAELIPERSTGILPVSDVGRTPMLRDTGKMPVLQEADFVLVTVKSYDTSAAAEALRRIDTGRFVVVSMQNGYGNVERLTETFGPDRVLCARVITGFVPRDPGTVEITVHADAVTIGRFDGGESPAAEQLAAALTAAGLPTRASRQVQSELWAKILYNCALNPLGAILGVVYGKLAERAETRTLMDRIIDEAYAVMTAHNLPRLHATPEAFRAAFYSRMVPPTAAHTPSMLQDLRAGKRTEIDALNGAIVALAEQAGLDAPINRVVTAMVKFLEWRGR